MSVKLLLNPASDAMTRTHAESGVTFRIRPISPAQHDEIRRNSLSRSGALDVAKWGENYAVAAIADWGSDIGDANGPLPCDEPNLRKFGRVQAVNIMPWIVEQATGLDQFRIEEEAEAKKG